MTIKALVKKVTIGKTEYEVIELNQLHLGIETWIYPNTQINVYGNDAALKTLAGIYDAVCLNKFIAILERHAPEGADLVIFHGQSSHLNFRIVHQIKTAMKKAHTWSEIKLEIRPECNEDNINNEWKFDQSLSVRVEDHMVLISGSTLGLRLSALECLNLTESDLGHQHFDSWSTKQSIELIIRNTNKDS